MKQRRRHLPRFFHEFGEFLLSGVARQSNEWLIQRTNAVRGVHSDGFMTIVQPTARAGATFQALGNVVMKCR